MNIFTPGQGKLMFRFPKEDAPTAPFAGPAGINSEKIIVVHTNGEVRLLTFEKEESDGSNAE